MNHLQNVNHNIFSNNKIMCLLIQQIFIKYLLRAQYFAGHYVYKFNFKSLLEVRIMTIKVFLCDEYNEKIQVTNWRKFFWFHKSKTDP